MVLEIPTFARIDVVLLVSLRARNDCLTFMTRGAILLLAPKSVMLEAYVVGSDVAVGIERERAVMTKSTSALVHAPFCSMCARDKRCYFQGITWVACLLDQQWPIHKRNAMLTDLPALVRSVLTIMAFVKKDTKCGCGCENWSERELCWVIGETDKRRKR